MLGQRHPMDDQRGDPNALGPGLTLPPTSSSSRFRAPSPSHLPLATPGSLIPPRPTNQVRNDSPLLGWSGSLGSSANAGSPPVHGHMARGPSYQRQWSMDDDDTDANARRVSSDSGEFHLRRVPTRPCAYCRRLPTLPGTLRSCMSAPRGLQSGFKFESDILAVMAVHHISPPSNQRADRACCRFP